MNKETVEGIKWLIKWLLEVLVLTAIVIFLFMDSKWHFHRDRAGDFLMGGIAGWALTFWHLKRGKKD